MTISKITTGIGRYESANLQQTQNRQGINQKQIETQKAKDTISLSSEARLLASGLKEAQKAPEIRQDKVDALKQQIATNNYTLDSKAIATKIVDEQMEIWK